MRSLIINEPYQPATEYDVSSLENKLGISLPSDYRQFLFSYNGGGRPDPCLFPIAGNTADDHGIVEWLYVINVEDQFDLVDVIEVYEERLPPELLPIAEDPGGNLICLSVSGPNRGKVYFWDHEGEGKSGEASTYSNVYYVADSFQAFIDSLDKCPE